MGTKCAPIYATLTLGYLEEAILYPTVQRQFGENVAEYFTKNYYRFLDDVFLLWPPDFPDILQLVNILNSLNENIKFTHSISKTEIPFVDILVKIDEDYIVTDIYRKPTDSQNDLDFTSSHPSHTKRNIPFSLCRRICTIIQPGTLRNARLDEVKHRLHLCHYPLSLINAAIDKFKTAPSSELRKTTMNKEDDTKVFL